MRRSFLAGCLSSAANPPANFPIAVEPRQLYTKDVVILECNSLRARVIAQQLSTLEEAIVELDAKIAQIHGHSSRGSAVPQG